MNKENLKHKKSFTDAILSYIRLYNGINKNCSEKILKYLKEYTDFIKQVEITLHQFDRENYEMKAG